MRLVFRLRVHKTLNCNGVFFKVIVMVLIVDLASKMYLGFTFDLKSLYIFI